MSTSIPDEVLFVYEPHGPAVEEYVEAADLLHKIQVTDGHKKCPNTNAKPAPCEFCQSHYHNKYAVWQALMIINAPD